MIILGLSGALGHDASAALLVDGQLQAAAEEERFLRDKHAKNKLPEHAARFCLEQAGITAAEVDCVAFPYAPVSLFSPARWQYARRYWYAPDRALDALLNGNRRFRRLRKRVLSLGETLGINWQNTEFVPVPHHLAHASSAYHLSGFTDKCAILSVDGKGEYATTYLGIGEAGRITKVKEFYDPESLAGVYGAMTEYLGFEMLDGEYKVMGMAPYGDPTRHDFSRLIQPHKDGFRVDNRLVNTVGWRRYKKDGRGQFYGPPLVDWLGPPRDSESADQPYVDYAAAMQALFEHWVQRLLDTHLADVLQQTGRLAFAGGGALNVKLNQHLLQRADLEQLFVQPAAGDSGTALGAATYVAAEREQSISPLQHVYLGPAFDNVACEAALSRQVEAGAPITFHRMMDPVAECADLLTAGEPLAWFQGRMEFGPRALGARSILGRADAPGIADRINEQIKFRERWRPFCPSLLDRIAPEVLQSDHPAPYMTITFEVSPAWRDRIPEVVHADGTARAQVVSAASNPRYYALLEAMEARTGNGVLLNTSLNRRGEAVVCSPGDALTMFLGCDLKYLALEDWLVTKTAT